MARPKLNIDPKKVEDLAAIFCSNETIAKLLGCSADTIERRFAGALEKGREKGKMNLRNKQFEKAMEGNVVMLIWLGKQYLDQKERTEVSSDPDQPINITYSLANGPSRTAKPSA